MLGQPTSALGLIKSLKAAVDEKLFLVRKSFNEDTIYNVTGAKLLRIFEEKERGWITAYPLQFEHFIKDLTIERNGRELIGLQLRIRYVSLSEDKITSLISLSFRESHAELIFENIVIVFGPHWDDSTPKFMSPGQKFIRPTHPMGNQSIRYTQVEPGFSQIVDLTMRSDGSLFSVSFRQELQK